MQKGKKPHYGLYKAVLVHYYGYWFWLLRPLILVSLHVQGSIDDEEDLPEASPQTLLVFGGGDNEGSFFSDLFTMPVEELRRD